MIGLLATIAGRRAKTRDGQLKEYADLIRRHDRLKPADVARLDELAAVLGFGESAIAEHVAAVGEIAELGGKPQDFEAARQAHKAAGKALTDFDQMVGRRRIEEIEQRKALEKTRSLRGIEMMQADGVATRLGELRRKHPHLFPAGGGR